MMITILEALIVSDLIVVADAVRRWQRSAPVTKYTTDTARWPLYKTKGGKYLRVCPDCAGKLGDGLVRQTSDRGKARNTVGCEFCTPKSRRTR